MSKAKPICNVERLAGTLTITSAALAVTVSPWFLVATAFVGVNQWVYALAGDCPASLVLRRACRAGRTR
jgi:ABC-type transport system involved in cytochrome bd biosynthesis fused ATPase/permease subunit